MLSFGKVVWAVALLVVLVAGSGCLPTDSSPADEEREPHYVLGKSRVNALDYQGAVEAFQEALEVNPRSAPAHFQLACIYDSKLPDPAAAIFHFQEYLRLNPQAGNQDVIRQSIYSCKQQLAADVLPLPSAPAAEKQLESLMQQNSQLQQQVAQLTDKLRQWNQYYNSEQAARAQANAYVPAKPSYIPPGPASSAVGSGQANPAYSGSSAPSVPLPAGIQPHTHKVAAGETLATIARKAGVSIAALESANPSVNPRHLRAGQVINLPIP
jgi:LysM repeat protein